MLCTTLLKLIILLHAKFIYSLFIFIFPGNNETYDDIENNEKYRQYDNDPKENDDDTEWSVQGKKIYDDVVRNLNDNGIEENALHNVDLAKKLLRDIKKIALWSSVCHEKFNTGGRIPPSSAPVEGEIGRLKRGIFLKKRFQS